MKKDKRAWDALGKILSTLVQMAVGAGAGYVLGYYAVKSISHGGPLHGALMVTAALGCLILAALIQTSIHELGHLIFGLISGYEFCSFRVAGLMVVKDQSGKLAFKYMSIPGTLGQCLMAPPPVEEDGYMPTGLYNMGGVLLNFVSAFLFLWLYFLVKGSMASFMCLSLFGLGLAFALLNGIPLRSGGLPNDGHNAVSLGKDPAALSAFRTQLLLAQAQSQGQRLSQMPEEWFSMPKDEDMAKPLPACQAVFLENRYMDLQLYDQAKELADKLLEGDYPLPQLYRQLLKCDLICLELMDPKGPQAVDELLDKDLSRFIAKTGSLPSVLRTRYILALLKDRDTACAQAAAEAFDKLSFRYPYAGEVQGERDLMEQAQELSQAQLASDRASEIARELDEP